MTDPRLRFAADLAREAGELALSFRDRPGGLEVSTKGHQDFVTEADLAVERLIRDRLAAAFPEVGIGLLVDDVQRGEVRGVLALGWASAAALEELAPLTELSAFVSLTTHVGALPTAAAVVLPVTDSFEMHGTFVNAKGLAQTFKRAIPAPPGVEPAWKTLVELGAAMGQKLPYDTLQDVRAAIDAQTKGVTAAAGAAEATA